MCYRQIWNKHFGKNKLFRRRLSKSTFPFDCDTLKKKTLSFRIDLLNYYFYGISVKLHDRVEGIKFIHRYEIQWSANTAYTLVPLSRFE